MTWMAPWAWLGLGTLVLPVLVHLLARSRVPRIRLPTLRFVEAAPPAAVRRARLSDPLLLLLRLLVLLLAAGALARPQLATPPTAGPPGAAPPTTRVTLVDASPSMERPTPAGPSALETARTRALEEAGTSPGAHRQGAGGALQPGATYLFEVEGRGDALARAVAGAGADLERLPGLREVVVLSDFQVGTFPLAGDQASPSELRPFTVGGVGLRLEAVAVDTAAGLARVLEDPGSGGRVAVSSTGEGVLAAWEGIPRPTPPAGVSAWAPGLDEDLALRLAELAALPVPSSLHPFEIHFLTGEAADPGVGPPLQGARPWPEAPAWMADALLALALDPVLEAAAMAHPLVDPAGAGAVGVDPAGAGPARPGLGARGVDPGLPVVRGRAGEPLVTAVLAGTVGEPRLVLDVRASPESFLAVALLAAMARAFPWSAAWADGDPRVLSGSRLDTWRQPAVVRPPDPSGEGEGRDLARLLWLVVLLLLAVEWVVRGRRPGTAGATLPEGVAT